MKPGVSSGYMWMKAFIRINGDMNIRKYIHHFLGLHKTGIVMLFLSTFWIQQGCNKISNVEKSYFGFKEFGDTSNNLFQYIAHDQQNNIYYIENQYVYKTDSAILVKINPQGKRIWRKTLYVNQTTKALQIFDTGDGLLITFVLGTDQYHTYFGKTDYNGNLKWTQKLPMENGMNAAVGPNHTFMFFGIETASQAMGAYCTDTSGKTIWTKVLGKSVNYVGDEPCTAGCYSKDGGFIFAGVDPFGINNEQQSIIFKVDVHGNTQWVDTFPADVYESDTPFVSGLGVVEAPDGQVYAVFGASYTISTGSDYHIYIVKADPTSKTHDIQPVDFRFTALGSGFPSSGFYFGLGSDNNFYMAGQTDISGGLKHYNMFICKFDASYHQIFYNTYGGLYDVGGVVIPYMNGGFLLGVSTSGFGKGYNKNDIAIMVTDGSGNLLN